MTNKILEITFISKLQLEQVLIENKQFKKNKTYEYMGRTSLMPKHLKKKISKQFQEIHKNNWCIVKYI